MHVLDLKPEKILYIYMASCIAVLLFNILYIFIDKYKAKTLEKNSLEYLDLIKEQLARVENGLEPEELHLKLLNRKLRRPEKLRAYEYSVAEAAKQAASDIMKLYFEKVRPVFLSLTDTYERRDEIEQAYFVSLIEKFGIDKGRQSFDGIIEFLVRMSISKDVYVRENSLQALFSIGNAEAVLSAWQKMEANQRYHSRRLLAEGLLRFTGDKLELSRILFQRRKDFNISLALPVFQFIRRYTGEFQQEMLELMQRSTEDKELRLEAVRYLRRYPYAPAREALQKFIWMRDYIDWEFAAMAAMTLSEYPGDDTVECLKEGLHATNWYVRHNCAAALTQGLKIPKAELYEVYNGKDRYAREILQYMEQKADLEQEKMELV